MTNKKLGNDFEARFCEILAANGFWVHNFAQNKAGQPADVIAVRNGIAYLIDCKVCSGNAFPLSRVEENQRLSMQKWSDCGNVGGWFAFLLIESDTIYMCPSETLEKLISDSRKTLDTRTIMFPGVSLDWWIQNYAA